MSSGQATVLGLELVLLGLIAVRDPNVLSFLKNWLSNFKGAVNSSG